VEKAAGEVTPKVPLHHGFTRGQVADAVEVVRTQRPWMRWVAVPTSAMRDFVKPQLVVVQFAYVVAVSVILLAELRSPHLPAHLLMLWVVESVANLVFRVALFAGMFRFTPRAFAESYRWRLVPAFNAFVVGCHWVWTATLFVGPTLNFTTVATLMAYLLMSIAVMAIAAASLLSAVIYITFLWTPMSVQLLRIGEVDGWAFSILLFGAISILLIGFFVVLNQVRGFLVKSDEVELLIAELQESNELLESMRGVATTELASRSEFFNSASHDFGQRLHALKLLAHAAFSHAASASAISPLRRLSEAIEELESYVRGLLDFAKFEGSAASINREPTHLQDVFQQLDLQFEDVAEAAGKAIRFRTTTIELLTDRAMLSRILQNLVDNAIKFTRRGVLVGARRRGDACVIEVWDQGRGLPPGAEVFRPFYQGAAGVSSVRIGVGLGLAIVKRFADNLGYSLEVRSEHDRGSVFRLTVPTVSPNAARMKA